MTCREFAEALFDLVGGDLPPDVKARADEQSVTIATVT